MRGGAGTGYDEFVDAAGNVRPAWQELAECVGERGRGGLDRLRSVVRGLVDNDGITYIQVDRHGDAVHQRRRHRGAGAVAPRRVAAADLAVGLGRRWNPVWCNAPGCSTPC